MLHRDRKGIQNEITQITTHQNKTPTMKFFRTTSAIGMLIILVAALCAGYASAEAKDLPPALSKLFDQPLSQSCDSESRAEVMARANSGDMKAQHLLGLQASLGACEKDGEPDRKTAIYYLSKSAAQFYPPSMYHLAINLNTQRTKPDMERFHLFLGAAERGFQKAEMDVAVYYYDKRSPVYNNPEAYAWFSQCALHDSAMCDESFIEEVRERMSKSDLKKAEQLKIRLLEKMKTVPKFEDVRCCTGGSSGFGMRRE